jgi:hypothetical protein
MISLVDRDSFPADEQMTSVVPQIVTKLHASGPQKNRATLQHEQRSPGE